MELKPPQKVKFESPHLRTPTKDGKVPQLWVDELNINVLMDSGGVGDMIARIPALKYLAVKNPHCRISVWCPHYFLELGKILLSGLKNIQVEPVGRYKFERRVTDILFNFSAPQHSTLSTNLTRHAFNVLCDNEVPEEYLAYPKLTPRFDHMPESIQEKLKGKKYVVLCTEYTSPARQLPADSCAELAVHLAEKGYHIVIMGKSKYEISAKRYMEASSTDRDNRLLKLSNVIDIRNETPHLVNALAVLAHSYCVIGVDNGLHHMAALTDVPIIAAYTSVAPVHREIIRNGVKWHKIAVVEQPKTLECRYCQSYVTSMINHIWLNCLYAANKNLRYECCANITGERLIKTFDQMEEMENSGRTWASSGIYNDDNTYRRI